VNGALANFDRYKIVSPDYAKLHIAAPHGWSAAEMFLLLLDARR
jgi:hypothetical protein